MENILIAGGSGYIGRALTKMLQEKGYKVSWLTREIDTSNNITQYLWDWKQKKIDLVAIENVDLVINLAGANLHGKRWNKEWKKEIYDSRILATMFLFEIISIHPNKIKSFFSASATGYYGCITSKRIFNESDLSAHDFLAKSCNDWDLATNKFNLLGIRTVIVRTGIVLSEDSEAYKKISFPIRIGLGAIIGSGNQFFSWIHIVDLCNIYLKLISDYTMRGVFNAVAPEYLTNKKLIEIIAKAYSKSIWLPNIPSIVIKLIFGEIADSILNGSRISCKKIMDLGFEFKYSKIETFINAHQTIV